MQPRNEAARPGSVGAPIGSQETESEVPGGFICTRDRGPMRACLIVSAEISIFFCSGKSPATFASRHHGVIWL